MVRVKHLSAHHLVSSADSKDGCSAAVGLYYGLGAAVAPELIEIVYGRLGAGYDYDVALLDVFSV